MTTHALRGRERYFGKIDERILPRSSITEGLDYTRQTAGAYGYLEQRILINNTTLLKSIYWDLLSGTYQLSINGTNYDDAHILSTNVNDEEWDLSVEKIFLIKGNYYNIRMTRTSPTNWRDNDSPGYFNGTIWEDIINRYDDLETVSYCAPLKIKGIVDT